MAWSLGSGEFPCHGWKTLMSLLRLSLLPWDTVIHLVDILLWSILKKQKSTNLYQLGAPINQKWPSRNKNTDGCLSLLGDAPIG